MSTAAERARPAGRLEALAEALEDGYSRPRLALLVAGSFLLLCLRKPDALVHPQFVAEDGAVFFREQMLYGAAVVARPVAGYLCLLPRLIALVSAPLPVYWIPFAYAVLGGLIQSAATAFFFVPAHRFLLRADGLRALVCLTVVALGPSELLLLNAVNVQWPLFAAGVLLLVGAIRRAELGRLRTAAYAAAALAIGLTTSLLAAVAIPLGTWALLRRRAGSPLVVALFVLTGAAQVTAFALTGTAAPGSGARLAGESPVGYVARALYATALSYVYRVAVPTTAGEPAARWLAATVPEPATLVVAALLLPGLGWLAVRAGRQTRLAIACALAVSVLSIGVPLVVRGLLGYFDDWRGPFFFWAAGRYFVLPVAVFVWLVALGLERASPRGLRSCALLVLLCAGGLLGNFRVEPYPRTGWRKQARRVAAWRADYRAGRPRPGPLLVRTAPRGWFFVLE